MNQEELKRQMLADMEDEYKQKQEQSAKRRMETIMNGNNKSKAEHAIISHFDAELNGQNSPDESKPKSDSGSSGAEKILTSNFALAESIANQMGAFMLNDNQPKTDVPLEERSTAEVSAKPEEAKSGPVVGKKKKRKNTNPAVVADGPASNLRSRLRAAAREQQNAIR